MTPSDVAANDGTLCNVEGREGGEREGSGWREEQERKKKKAEKEKKVEKEKRKCFKMVFILQMAKYKTACRRKWLAICPL